MIRKTLCLVAIVASVTTTAAFAVTPEEVWENWQSMSTSGGQQLTVGNVVRNGDRLDVSDVVITHTDPVGGSSVISFEALSFQDNGDDTVTVLMPESYPMSLVFPSEGENPGTLKLTLSQPGMTLLAGGSATETRYDFTAPTTTVVLDEVTDTSGMPMGIQAELVMTGASGSYVATPVGEEAALQSAFEIEALALILEDQDSSVGPGRGKINLSLANVAMDIDSYVLGADVMENLALALNQGAAMDFGLSFGAMSAMVDVVDETGPLLAVLELTGGGVDMILNKDMMNYNLALTGAKVVASTPGMPVPQAELGLGEFGFSLRLPVAKSSMPQDFTFLTKFIDLTVSEELWGLMDPVGTLSRDPVTFVVDLKGTGNWNYDIMAPDFDIEAVENPGEIHTLDRFELRAKAAGADVGATGKMTFDNTDLMTYPGVPNPTGTITVTMKGVQTLINNMIAMGFLPEDEATGFRMMLAMLARPGLSADELISELEFKDGGLFANGQQIW